MGTWPHNGAGDDSRAVENENPLNSLGLRLLCPWSWMLNTGLYPAPISPFYPSVSPCRFSIVPRFHFTIPWCCALIGFTVHTVPGLCLNVNRYCGGYVFFYTVGLVSLRFSVYLSHSSSLSHFPITIYLSIHLSIHLSVQFVHNPFINHPSLSLSLSVMLHPPLPSSAALLSSSNTVAGCTVEGPTVC